jgi:L,D-transpeptidase ErfK/SrfK
VRVAGCVRAVSLVVFVVMVVSGCAPLRRWADFHAPGALPALDEASFERKPMAAYRIPTPRADAPTAAIIGKARTYRVREGETLLDIARYFDLGFNEIAEANPGVDAWIPPVGSTVVIPTEWIVPCCTYQGLVVNIPEMRLYLFEAEPGNPAQTVVRTYPVALGRDDRRTPRGRFKVRGKTVNPRWIIPESIRREHIEERGDDRRSIAGGDPDNPLGKYRIELNGKAPYSIHGTNVPWGAGMQVSHGCIRLYPEDIERLFPRARVGMPVAFVYAPVKVGQRGGAVYMEVHRDIYGYTPSLYDSAMGLLTRGGLAKSVDSALIKAAIRSPMGVPQPVSRAPGASGAAIVPVGRDG